MIDVWERTIWPPHTPGLGCELLLPPNSPPSTHRMSSSSRMGQCSGEEGRTVMK